MGLFFSSIQGRFEHIYNAFADRVTSSGAPKRITQLLTARFSSLSIYLLSDPWKAGFFVLMATIFTRIKHLKVDPTQEVRMQIGKQVCTVYFSQKRRAKIFKIPSVEPEGTFMALSYPKSFNDTIDKIILRFCPPKRGKRPRVNRVGGYKPK